MGLFSIFLVGSEHDGPITAALFEFVMPGHSRPKDGVASARLCPGIHVFVASGKKGVDGRDKPGHDESCKACQCSSVSNSLSERMMRSGLTVDPSGRPSPCASIQMA
jgi:hypothetical protein